MLRNPPTSITRFENQRVPDPWVRTFAQPELSPAAPGAPSRDSSSSKSPDPAAPSTGVFYAEIFGRKQPLLHFIRCCQLFSPGDQAINSWRGLDLSRFMRDPEFLPCFLKSIRRSYLYKKHKKLQQEKRKLPVRRPWSTICYRGRMGSSTKAQKRIGGVVTAGMQDDYHNITPWFSSIFNSC